MCRNRARSVLPSGNYPRKFAKGVVLCNNTAPATCNPATNARDTNGLTPPNTGGAEWWSDYQFVPPLPVLDFAALRSWQNFGTVSKLDE